MMMLKTALSAGLICGLCLGSASAQPTPANDGTGQITNGMPTRSSEYGDPGSRMPKPTHATRHHRTARAAAQARGDKQPPGIENGNQPDRSSAGAGGGGGGG